MGILSRIFGSPKEGPRSKASVSVLMGDGEVKRGTFTYYPIYAGKLTQGACCLFLAIDDVTVAEGKGVSYFDALLALRDPLDERGATVLCWGARQYVWPTGMQGDMGAGLTASLRDEDGARGEEKSIFDPIDPEFACTASEQREFSKRMLANVLKKIRKPTSECS